MEFAGLFNALNASNAEATPLLARQTVQRIAPYIPNATAEKIGMAQIEGTTVAEGINIGQVVYQLHELRNPITGDRLMTPEIDMLTRQENYGKPDSNEETMPENWNPNIERQRQFLERQGVRLENTSGIQRGYSPSLPIGITSSSGRIENLPAGVTNIFNQGIQKISSTVQNQNKLTGQSLAVDKSGKILNPFSVGKDLGRFLGLSEGELSKGATEKEAHKRVALSFPDLAYLAATVAGFSQYVPKPDVLSKVIKYQQTYTGVNVTPENTFIDENGNVGGINEFGIREVYDGARGSSPSYDEWCGAMSPNAKRPTTLFGTYCMFHDIGYLRNGYFDLNSDYILVARIMNNLDKMGFQERVLAMTAAHYFLTVGNSIDMFKNILPANINEKPVPYPAKDISADIFGTQLPPVQRSQFYEGVKQGLDENLKLTMAPSKYNSTTLLPMFDSIDILEVEYYDIYEIPTATPVQEQGTEEVPNAIPVVPMTAPVDVPIEQVPAVIAEQTLPTTEKVDNHAPVLEPVPEPVAAVA